MSCRCRFSIVILFLIDITPFLRHPATVCGVCRTSLWNPASPSSTKPCIPRGSCEPIHKLYRYFPYWNIPPSIGFTIYGGQTYSLNFFRPPPSFKIKTSFGGRVSHTKAIWGCEKYFFPKLSYPPCVSNTILCETVKNPVFLRSTNLKTLFWDVS